ncbi:MAG: hypothetical protein HRT44_03040 [Bdellovibrionales bacterium]|nr:hypothetical protein [Bdellovibrionales bacterium]NQZ18222.1 hypothetical protein [Bdellovibrionales bacterium]
MIQKILLSLASLICISCASISTMQTAETTEVGKFDHAIALGSGKADVSEVAGVDIDPDDINDTSISFPMSEYMLRYGISESFDIGLRTTGFVYGLDVKWNFLFSQYFLMSAGVGGNYRSDSYNDGTGDQKNAATDIVPALFMDIVFDPLFRMYLVPKVVQRKVTASGQEDESITYAGGSVGMKWGRSLGVFVEYTALNGSFTPTGTNTDQNVDLSQFAAGFFF